MKILLLSHGDNGGGTWFLADAINRHTDHEARQFRTLQSGLDYPYHHYYPYNQPQASDDARRALCQWADVIHARETLNPLKGIPIPAIPIIMTYTGNNYRRRYKKYIEQDRQRGYIVTVSTCDLMYYYPDNPPIWLPNPREDLIDCVPKKHGRFTVAHAPTFRERKGTETVIKAINGLGDVDLELIENVPYQECLQRKAKCHAVIDQFRYGYGNNGIEAWALGMPTLGDVQGCDEYPFPKPVDLGQFFLDLCGFLPFVQVAEDVQALREAIEHLRNDKQAYREVTERGRAYFFAYHHAPVVAKRAVEIYEMALDMRHGQSYAPKQITRLEMPAVIRQRELNILSLATWDYAGCGFFLSEAINLTTDHHARAVAWQPSAYKFPRDIETPTLTELRGLWKWADVVHIHDSVGIWREQIPERERPTYHKPPKAQKLLASLPPKPTVITWHGTRYRNNHEMLNEIAKRNGWLTTCSTLDLAAYGPRWLPDCRPDLSQYVNRPVGQFIICHAPTHRECKGTEVVIKAMEGFDFDLIEHASWQECIERKGRASVYVEQFKVGYGCNSIEAWSMGIPVVSGAEAPEIRALIQHHIGCLPFVQCPPEVEAIRNAVERLRDDSRFYRKTVKQGQTCYHQFHAPEAAARQALAYYHEAILRGPARWEVLEDLPTKVVSTTPAAKRQHTKPAISLTTPEVVVDVKQGMVKVRYMGGNWGGETVTGAVTKTRYQFTVKQPVKYMDAHDAKALLEWDQGQHKSGPHRGKQSFVLEKE